MAGEIATFRTDGFHFLRVLCVSLDGPACTLGETAEDTYDFHGSLALLPCWMLFFPSKIKFRDRVPMQIHTGDWGDGSVGQVIANQAVRPEFRSSVPKKKPGLAHVCNPSTGTRVGPRQGYPWGVTGWPQAAGLVGDPGLQPSQANADPRAAAGTHEAPYANIKV